MDKKYKALGITIWLILPIVLAYVMPSPEWKQDDDEYIYNLDKVVENGNIEEIKDIWQQAEEKYNVEWELLKAIWKHETGNGTSKAWNELNNPGGLMYWNKSQGKMTLYKFDTKDDGIMFMAKILRKYYLDKGLTTIEEIGAKYCPVATNDNGYNKYWIPKVTQYYNEYKEE